MFIIKNCVTNKLYKRLENDKIYYYDYCCSLKRVRCKNFNKREKNV